MIYADVKADVKQLGKKNLQLNLESSYKKYIQNLKYNVKLKQTCIFYLILLGIPSILMLSAKNKGVGEWGVEGGEWVYLTDKNLLSVMKVICWQSLTRFCCTWFLSVQKNVLSILLFFC